VSEIGEPLIGELTRSSDEELVQRVKLLTKSDSTHRDETEMSHLNAELEYRGLVPTPECSPDEAQNR